MHFNAASRAASVTNGTGTKPAGGSAVADKQGPSKLVVSRSPVRAVLSASMTTGNPVGQSNHATALV